MSMPSSLEKGLFIFSVALFAYLGGFATRWHDWFPNAHLERASRQTTALLTTWSAGPPNLHDKVYDRSGAQTVRPDRVQPGLTLITSSWSTDEGWTAGLNLIDEGGAAVHRWRFDRRHLFPDSVDRRGNPALKAIHGTHLFPNGDVLVNVEYVGTARLDACGRVQWRLSAGSHHAISRTEAGSFWIPGTSRTPRAGSEQYPDGFPGIEGRVWLDQLLHVTAEGAVTDKLNVLDVLYANDLERYLFKAYKPNRVPGHRKGGGRDITHLNDVEALSSSMADEYPTFEAGDLLISLRYIDLVLVLDPQSKTVKWHTRTSLIQQHDPDFIGNGWIGVFNNNTDYSNRGATLGGSQIVTFQPHTDSMNVRFPSSRSKPFYTNTRGKWQQLANGNMLLTEANAGRVVEVTSSGRTVWEWIKAPYEEGQVPVVTKGARYDLSRDDVAAWSCSNKPSR
jgi:hypothetical protein